MPNSLFLFFFFFILNNLYYFFFFFHPQTFTERLLYTMGGMDSALKTHKLKAKFTYRLDKPISKISKDIFQKVIISKMK